mmetsp:Transcript_76588/g.215412  ORF Transcript_76588/g.215412 Transcript_76588/m.215412 type:complete len:108 (+) Transcript_76588:856-1179(+)
MSLRLRMTMGMNALCAVRCAPEALIELGATQDDKHDAKLVKHFEEGVEVHSCTKVRSEGASCGEDPAVRREWEVSQSPLVRCRMAGGQDWPSLAQLGDRQHHEVERE